MEILDNKEEYTVNGYDDLSWEEISFLKTEEQIEVYISDVKSMLNIDNSGLIDRGYISIEETKIFKNNVEFTLNKLEEIKKEK